MDRPGWRWWLMAIIIILWTALLVGGFFWAHKPFDLTLLAGLGRTLGSMGVWLGLTALGAALGRRLMGPALADEWPFTRLALTAGVGLGLLAVLMGLIGLLGGLRPPVAWGVVLLLAGLLWRDLRHTLADVRRLALPRPGSRWQRWFLFYGLFSLSLTLVTALAPPIAWDSLVYHLTGPKLYIAAGRLGHPIDLPYLGFPALGQMQFTLGMLLIGDGVAALLHFGYGLLALALTVGLARRAFGDTAAWFAGVILLSVPSLFTLMSWPYVDITLMYYATAAFYAFYRWRAAYQQGQAETAWLVLMGLYCGFSGGVKYTAVVIPLALALSLAASCWRDGLVALARRLAIVAAIALLLVLPWLLENWLTTGNPVYPFFLDDALYWDAWRGWWYDRPGTGLAATAPWRLPLVPLEATILGTQGSNFYEATIGPLLLLAAGLLLFVWRCLSREEKRVAGHMLLFFLLNYLLWINGVARTGLLLRIRFLFPVFGVIAVLGGVAMARLPELRRPQLDINWMVLVFFNLTLALSLFTLAVDFLALNPLPVVVGVEAREQYLARTQGTYQAVLDEVNGLPPAARIYFLWEPRSYRCQADCWPDALLDRWLRLTQDEGLAPAGIAARWRAEGVTHVLLHQQGLDFIVEAAFDPVTAADLAALAEFQAQYLTELARWGDEYILYELRP